jgi:hypothetical protein
VAHRLSVLQPAALQCIGHYYITVDSGGDVGSTEKKREKEKKKKMEKEKEK